MANTLDVAIRAEDIPVVRRQLELLRAIRNAAQAVFDDYMEQWPNRPYAGVTGEMGDLGVALLAYDELEQGGTG